MDQETDRLAALHDYHILDTAAEQDFEEITKIASQICGTPISLITLVDEQRQWFKSRRGISAQETPREHAFCAHAIEVPDQVMVVENPTKDPRFQNNPLVTGEPNIRFYAGAPIVNSEGFALGTLCVIDQQPRTLTEDQLASLQVLAHQAMAQLELRKKVRELEAANQDLNEYAHIVSHDLKSPLNTLISLVNLFKSQYDDLLDEKGHKLLSMMEMKVDHLKKLIQGILDYSLMDRKEDEKKWVDINQLIPRIIEDISPDEHVEIQWEADYPTLWTNETYAYQIFQNLLTNAIKYNDKPKVRVEIATRRLHDSYWEFRVSDNGKGIEAGAIEQVFEPFITLNSVDRYGQEGTGIGLATVKKLVIRSGGQVRVESVPDQGSAFIFTIMGSAPPQ